MPLTDRETTVLLLRQQGLTQGAIARKLKITQGAVSGFENNAYRKIRDALDTIAYARRRKLSIPHRKRTT
jgi:transcriptional regulator